MSKETDNPIRVNPQLTTQLISAIKEFHRAKNRYHSQIAAAKMFELVGLPAQYPDGYKKP